MSGTLPNDLCYLLPQLEYLDIAINYIHGEIPRSLSSCGRLKVLSMSNNQLSGRLPNHIGNMSSLEELYLARMNLTGSLPNEIRKLSILREFRAFQNHLTGTLPASISNISTLENFVVADNNLDGNIPLGLGKLSRLKGLSLRSNNFSGEIPSSIFNISGLQVIELSFNILSGNLQLGLRHWISPSLLGLILATNQFTGTIPSSISNSSQLEMLDLGDNMFSGHVPLAIAKLDKLEVFSIENNQITNDPSANEISLLTSLSKCKNLKGVVLSGNPFNTVLPNMLDIGNKSLSLEKLYATDCHFKGNIPSGISNFSNLIVLDLSNNKLSGLFPKTLQGLQGLQGLYLGNNVIKGSLPSTLCYLKDLSELHLEHNKLTGDVYSFGVLLMEMFTRKKPTDEMFQGDFTMRKWVSDSLPYGVMEIVGSNLLTRQDCGKEIEQCFVMVMGIAMECTADIAEERITMKDVIVRLKHTLQNFNQNVSVGLVIN